MTRVLALALAARAAWVDESLYHINPLSYDPSKLVVMVRVSLTL